MLGLSNMSYQSEGLTGLGANAGSGFYFNDDNTPHKQSKPLTKKEKKVMKIITIVVFVLTAIISLLFGWTKGFYFGFSAFVYLLIFVLMPYIFIRKIIDHIKEKRQNKKNKKKNKQLELPL